jgi:hypothetical protein
MRNKYYIVNVPSWGKVYYIVNPPGVNLPWGKVYSMTPVLALIVYVFISPSYRTLH